MSFGGASCWPYAFLSGQADPFRRLDRCPQSCPRPVFEVLPVQPSVVGVGPGLAAGVDQTVAPKL